MLSRYYHTAKHLRLIQIVNRVFRHLYHPKPDLRSPPGQRKIIRKWSRPCQREPSMIGSACFRFLNETREIDFPKAWNEAGPSKLWIYNLHYFDDLNAVDSGRRNTWHESLIIRWVNENPPASGIGWDAYPLSLRIVNWIKWALAGNALNDRCLHSLAIQSRQLRRSLEFHLLGNHLFENAKALVFAGLFFSGDEAEQWLRTGIRLLDEQIQEQVLSDGAHFELSPMYHALILEGLLDLLNIFQTYGYESNVVRYSTILRMFEWLRTMSHPDDNISFFNDAAIGIAPSLGDLEEYAADLGVELNSPDGGSCLLEASGYARLENEAAVLFADVGDIGPDYLPAHAHADSLSFEFSLHGRRVLVNSGTSVYGSGEERIRQRGTAAHNTLRLDGVDSSEVWSGFRVARRAHAWVEQCNLKSEPVLKAVHNGYCRLAGHPLHMRSWSLSKQDLEIRDIVDGDGEHLIEIFFHFYPGILIDEPEDAFFLIRRREDSLVIELRADKKMSWSVESGFWHPGFGLCETNKYLHGIYQGRLPVRIETQLSW